MSRDRRTSDNIKSAILGAVIGDALGVPYEFSSCEAMKKSPATGMIGNGTYNQPVGTWSDDSSMLLCTAESLSQGYDLNDMAQRFLRWFDEGYMTPHGETFDYGITTAEALRALRRGVSPLESGGSGENDNGNGSLMRILPIALRYHAAPRAELLQHASDVSSITHAHPRSRLACGIYCLLVAELLNSSESDSEALRGMLRKTLSALRTELPGLVADSDMNEELSHFDRLLAPGFENLPESEISSGGYVLHTLEAAVWCVLSTESYEEAVLVAVNLGGDTDTTACVAGGLAGVVYGMEGIPETWLEALQKSSEVIKIADRVAFQS
ncbi:MAG: ADP-ribosylglycohydrolase family protein [Bacteroidota bacterium]